MRRRFSIARVNITSRTLGKETGHRSQSDNEQMKNGCAGKISLKRFKISKTDKMEISKSPSLGDIYLSRRFHRPIYFTSNKFTANSETRRNLGDKLIGVIVRWKMKKKEKAICSLLKGAYVDQN